MGKKMKGVVPMGLLTYGAGGGGGYADANISFKHQNLLQDYHELKKETDSMKKNLVFARQRKRSVLAEVNFLRRRYKYLSVVKSPNHLKEQEYVAQVSSGSHKKLCSQNRISKEKGAAQLHQLPPRPYSNHRGRVYSGKEDLDHRKIVRIRKETAQQISSPLSDFNNKRRVNMTSTKSPISHVTATDHNLGNETQQHNIRPNNKRKLTSSKKYAISSVAPIIGLNFTDRRHIGNDVALSNMAPLLDLNQDSSLNGREASCSSRAPIFDLNEISIAEEDMHLSNSAPREELKKALMRAGNDDQFNHDLTLSMCRNSGEALPQLTNEKSHGRILLL